MSLQFDKVERRLFSVDDVYKMIEAGLIGDKERLELIDGELLTMPAPTPAHSQSVMLITAMLTEAFGQSHYIRCQLPLTVSERSEPEPDFVVVSKTESWNRHPTTAPLVVEVSLTSLAFDRQKCGLYASASVPEYWIVDLNDRCLEVYTEPIPDSEAPWGFAYGVKHRLGSRDRTGCSPTAGRSGGGPATAVLSKRRAAPSATLGARELERQSGVRTRQKQPWQRRPNLPLERKSMAPQTRRDFHSMEPPEKKKGSLTGALRKISPAVTYSPTRSPEQYHRRWKA